MAHEKPSSDDKDEYGLTVQKYVSRVLVVVPPAGFSEETLRHARASLFNVHVGTWSVSTETQSTVLGRLQDEFLVDGSLADANLDDYSGVIFAAGEGDGALAENEAVLALARGAREQGKLVAAWGTSVAILARAGVLAGLAVTGDPALEDVIRRAGAKYTGVEVQRDGKVVTARDESAGLRFGKALVQVVAIL